MISVTGLALTIAAQAQSVDNCLARSGTHSPTVVELYTSEGCNSCPPADQWLSRLKSEHDVVAMAFHVDYWDRLGWKDRFASPVHTDRQARESDRNGAGYSYTPQVVIDGVDRKRWYREPPARRAELSAADVELRREGSSYFATVTPRSNFPTKLAAYWTVTEHDHVSQVRAGENKGATLKHDFVVREYQAVAPWSAAKVTLRFDMKTTSNPAHPRTINLVVIDAHTGKPLQAVKLGC